MCTYTVLIRLPHAVVWAAEGVRACVHLVSSRLVFQSTLAFSMRYARGMRCPTYVLAKHVGPCIDVSTMVLPNSERPNQSIQPPPIALKYIILRIRIRLSRSPLVLLPTTSGEERCLAAWMDLDLSLPLDRRASFFPRRFCRQESQKGTWSLLWFRDVAIHMCCRSRPPPQRESAVPACVNCEAAVPPPLFTTTMHISTWRILKLQFCQHH